MLICRICSNAADNTMYRVREMQLGLREQFEYFKCSRCGCLQISTVPADMSRYYPESYYAYVGGRQALPTSLGGALRGVARRVRNRFAVLRRGSIGRMLHRFWPNEELVACIDLHFPGDGVRTSRLAPGSRVLDVGCGAGDLLVALQSAGFPSLLGIDIYSGGGPMPRAPLIQNRRIDEVSGEWDLVMFHHSFEHMAEPREVLRAVGRLLHPEGVCLIRIPVVSSYAWEHYGVDWSQLDAPRHFYLHTEESLRRLADESGLEVSKIVYDSNTFQFVASELYRRDIPLYSSVPVEVQARASAFSPDELAAFERRARDLNAERRGDQAAFYLRRRRRPA